MSETSFSDVGVEASYVTTAIVEDKSVNAKDGVHMFYNCKFTKNPVECHKAWLPTTKSTKELAPSTLFKPFTWSANVLCELMLSHLCCSFPQILLYQISNIL